MGRPRLPGTDAERAAARRQRVRENVRAFRQRQRNRPVPSEHESSGSAAAAASTSASTSGAVSSSRTSSSRSSPGAQARSPAPEISIEEPTRLVAITRQPRGQTPEWSLLLPFRVEFGPPYAHAFIEASQFQAQPGQDVSSEGLFDSMIIIPPSPPALSDIAEDDAAFGTLDNFTTVEFLRVDICCYDWTRSVTIQAVSPGAEMLKEALLAASLSILGTRRNDPALSLQAVQIQTVALQKLREGINQYTMLRNPNELEILTATTLTWSLSELLVNKSWAGFSVHLRGIGALIQHAGPAALDSHYARVNFICYRAAEAAFSLVERRQSFLAQPEWINLHWREGDQVFAHPVHSLLDIAFQIPAQMELYDSTPGRSSSAARRQLQGLDALASELNAWSSDLYQQYAQAIYTTERATWEGLHTDVINFSNDTVGISYTLYAGVRTALFSIVQQLARDLQQDDPTAVPVLSGAKDECLKWSRIACQCLEYFFARNRRIVGQITVLYPFDMAWAVFVEFQEKYQMNMSRELIWCQATAARLETEGVPVLRKRSQV